MIYYMMDGAPKKICMVAARGAWGILHMMLFFFGVAWNIGGGRKVRCNTGGGRVGLYDMFDDPHTSVTAVCVCAAKVRSLFSCIVIYVCARLSPIRNEFYGA